MSSELSSAPNRETVDLTGLPGPVAQGIRQLVRALREGQPASLPTAPPRPRLDELERLLDEFAGATPGKILPADFSRADIYDDHD